MSTDLHTLSGAYALHALSDEERAMFARHLEECEACRDEVREFEEVVGRMGAGEADVPPVSLRARVMTAVDQHPQLPPRVTPIERARSRRWTTRLTVAAAAAVLVIAGAIGVAELQGDQGSTVPSAGVAQVFHAPDARIETVPTSNGGRLRVALSEESGRMAVRTDALRRLARDRVYQLWAVHNGRATSVGVVHDLATGKVMPIPASGTTVAVTVEPAGGSPQPTGKPIVSVDPSAV